MSSKTTSSTLGNKSESPTTGRSLFLRQILGLAEDPFALSTAEQELAISQYGSVRTPIAIPAPERYPLPFFEYFVPPPVKVPKARTLLGVLRESRLALLFGERGSGKTMLRLALEAYVRSFPQDDLIVSHPLREEDPQTLSRDMAVDLFIQIVEQGRLEPASDPERLQRLTQALRPAARALLRVIQRMQETTDAEGPMSGSLHWPALGRPTVRPFLLTPGHREFLDQLSSLLREEPETLIEPAISFEAACRWGFQRILLLIDDVDFHHRSEEAMQARLLPLIERLPIWHQGGVDLKLFLPSALRPWIISRVSHLSFFDFEATLEWDEVSLRRLLIQRFRASGSRRMGLDDLAPPPLSGKLDQILVKAAEGSPRRLIQIIDGLIQAHTARDPLDPLLQPMDWEEMRRQWPHDPPPPPPLEALIEFPEN